MTNIPKLTPFESTLVRAENFGCNLAKCHALETIIERALECEAAFSDDTMPVDVLNQARKELEMIEKVLYALASSQAEDAIDLCKIAESRV